MSGSGDGVAAAAVLSHEALALRILRSPALRLEDLGRTACACRALRAAVGKDDALFEAALWRDSPALAKAAAARGLSCRGLAASTHAALRLPRSVAPAWARDAAARPQEWTLVVDLFDAALAGGPRNVFSACVSLDALRQDMEGGEKLEARWLCACSLHADAAVPDVPSVAALVEECGCTGMGMTEMGTRQCGSITLRLLALHQAGGAAVICSRKNAGSLSTYTRLSMDDMFALYRANQAQTHDGTALRFEPDFGIRPRMGAHLMVFPAPGFTEQDPQACALGFGAASLHFEGYVTTGPTPTRSMARSGMSLTKQTSRSRRKCCSRKSSTGRCAGRHDHSALKDGRSASGFTFACVTHRVSVRGNDGARPGPHTATAGARWRARLEGEGGAHRVTILSLVTVVVPPRIYARGASQARSRRVSALVR